MRSTPMLLSIVFTTAASASLLAGCSANGSAIAPSAANSLQSRGQLAPQTAAAPLIGPAKSWMLPTAKSTPLLYVSIGEEDAVLVYPATGHNPAPIGQLSGFDIAGGLCVDTAGNLYVADIVNERVQVFHRGETSPFEILNAHGYATGEAVDNSGNVYVAVGMTGSQTGFVAIYPPGATEPTSMLTDNSRGFSPVNVALDADDNVFVSYNSALNTPPGSVDEFKAGTTTPIKLKITVKTGIGWIAEDQNNDLIVPETKSVRVYAAGSKKPAFTIGAGKKNSPSQAALNQAGDTIYVGEHAEDDVKVYSYPSGKLMNTITNGLPAGNPMDTVVGIAVDPPAPL